MGMSATFWSGALSEPSGAERKLWPVVISGQEIVWVRGFPAPARLRPKDGARQALLIRELPGLEDARHE